MLLMVTRRKDSTAERFWREDFREVHGKLLLKHNGRMGPKGTAQLAAEHADAAIAEYRRRFSR